MPISCSSHMSKPTWRPIPTCMVLSTPSARKDASSWESHPFWWKMMETTARWLHPRCLLPTLQGPPSKTRYSEAPKLHWQFWSPIYQAKDSGTRKPDMVFLRLNMEIFPWFPFRNKCVPIKRYQKSWDFQVLSYNLPWFTSLNIPLRQLPATVSSAPWHAGKSQNEFDDFPITGG